MDERITVLNRTQKSKIIDEFLERFKKQKIAIFSNFHGISVSKSQGLRRLLKKTGAEYKVAKKTLLDRALAGVGVETNTKKMKGEIGVTFGYRDEVSPAKTLLKFSKENETFKILGGILGARVLSDKEVIQLAKLPTREILLGQVVSTLQSPIRGLVMVLRGNLKNLVVVLQKIKESRI